LLTLAYISFQKLFAKKNDTELDNSSTSCTAFDCKAVSATGQKRGQET